MLFKMSKKKKDSIVKTNWPFYVVNQNIKTDFQSLVTNVGTMKKKPS